MEDSLAQLNTTQRQQLQERLDRFDDRLRLLREQQAQLVRSLGEPQGPAHGSCCM
jgi:hypothetical protein